MKNQENYHKRILLIYHSNICNKISGANAYMYNLFKILSDQGFKIDIFVPQSFDPYWENTEFITNVFLPDQVPSQLVESPYQKYIKKIKHLFQKNPPKKKILDWILPVEIDRFKKVVAVNNYSHIVFSYVYYAALGAYTKKSSKKILLLQDFCSIQEMQRNGSRFGDLVEEEISIIKSFDDALCISMDEISFFSNFTDTVNYHYVPHFLPAPLPSETQKDIDVLFFGSDNPHNVSGIHWFLDHTYPLLREKKYKVTIVGNICEKINQGKYSGIEYISHVETISDMYNRARIAICPLQSGTGLKIKIVEALSYGVPVVCTFKSLIGFPEKYNNGCTIADTGEAFFTAIDHLLSDPQAYEVQREQAKNQYNRYFNEAYICGTLKTVFPF